MAKPEWGVKRACPHCTARFYDLARDPIVCPMCEMEVDLEAMTKTKRGKAAAEAEPKAAAATAAAAKTDDEAIVTGDEELDALVADDDDDEVSTFTDDSLLEDDDDDDGDLGIETVETLKEDDES